MKGKRWHTVATATSDGYNNVFNKDTPKCVRATFLCLILHRVISLALPEQAMVIVCPSYISMFNFAQSHIACPNRIDTCSGGASVVTLYKTQLASLLDAIRL